MKAQTIEYLALNKTSRNAILITSPFTGKVIPLQEHPEPIFRFGILGPGITVKLSSHKILAPFDGTLLQVKNAGTEFILQAKNGLKVLINLTITGSQSITHTHIAQLNNYDTALKDVSELEAPSAWQSQFQSKDYVNPSAFKEFKAGVMGRGWQDTGVAAGDGFFQKGTGLDYDVGLGDVIAIGDFVYRAMENDWTDEWSDEDTKTSLHMAADVIFFLPIPGARVVSGLIHGVTSLWDWLD